MPLRGIVWVVRIREDGRELRPSQGGVRWGSPTLSGNLATSPTPLPSPPAAATATAATTAATAATAAAAAAAGVPPVPRSRSSVAQQRSTAAAKTATAVAAAKTAAAAARVLSRPLAINSSSYTGTPLTRNCFLLGPYSRTMPMALRFS